MKSESNLHRVRSEAGRAGGIARWENVAREPTVQVRVYQIDADWLRGWPGTIAEAVRALRQRKGRPGRLPSPRTKSGMARTIAGCNAVRELAE